MTGRAEQRPCPACGNEFTWTPASPRQRFCSQRCRLSWWGARRRQATAALNRASLPTPRNDARADGPHADGEHDTPGDAARGHNAGTLAAVPACPHCRQPVAIVAWLVPPAAASVATPTRSVTPGN
jgi:endogenous inhibitor of DNA gyrase (YacG/DUF329 family)